MLYQYYPSTMAETSTGRSEPIATIDGEDNIARGVPSENSVASLPRSDNTDSPGINSSHCTQEVSSYSMLSDSITSILTQCYIQGRQSMRRVERQLAGVDEKLHNMQITLQAIELASASISHLKLLPSSGTLPSGTLDSVTTPSSSQHALAASDSTSNPAALATGERMTSLTSSSTTGTTGTTGTCDSGTADSPLMQYHQTTGTFINIPLPESAIPPEHLRFFTLGDTTFPFDKTQVPNPPGVNFSDDLSRLFQEWHKSDLLIVNGHGIPVKHWPWFYQKKMGIRPAVWAIIRMKWLNWKVRHYQLVVVLSSDAHLVFVRAVHC